VPASSPNLTTPEPESTYYLVGLVNGQHESGLCENLANGFHIRGIADRLNGSHQTVSNAAHELTGLTAQAWAPQQR